MNEYIYDKGRVFMEKSKLLLNTLAKFFAGIILVAVLLFLPAGTFHYFNGWLFIALLFVPMMILGIVKITFPVEKYLLLIYGS